MVPYRATLGIPHEVVEYVSWLIYARRRQLRSRWRRLSCFQQAVLVLVHLRKNETLQQVGAGFGVSTAPAGRYVTETVDVLADHAPTLLAALHHHDPNEVIPVSSGSWSERRVRRVGLSARASSGVLPARPGCGCAVRRVETEVGQNGVPAPRETGRRRSRSVRTPHHGWCDGR